MLADLVSDENSDFCAYEDSSSPPGSSSPRSSASMEVEVEPEPAPSPGVPRDGAIKIRRIVVCGGAAPHAYWTAPKLPDCEYILVHHPGDRICALDLNNTRNPESAFQGFHVIRVNVPHPKLAAHLLGHGRHAYMHLCISPSTIGP